MNMPALRRHLPSQGTTKGKELAQSMMRGDTIRAKGRGSALEQLATVPEPWLERLSGEGMAYVALGYGEDLSKTELITSYSPERLMKEASAAKKLLAEVSGDVNTEIEEALSTEQDAFRQAMIERSRPEQLSEKLGAKLQEAGLGFAIKVTRDITPLSYIEGEFGIDRESYDEFLEPLETERGVFREVFLELNGSKVVKKQSQGSVYAMADDAILDPENDILLVPYQKIDGKRLSPVSRESYAGITGMMMDQHQGAHYWPNRLIVVDDAVANLPSKTTGNHSVILHETGHAMDYIAEGIEGLNHRETVDEMYRSDMERIKNGEKRLLTPRAHDNAREYFAEAVEAYLTQPVEGDEGWYKVENHFEALQKQNPELYAYVDKVMRLPGVEAAVSA
jgi:hypothetical protein